MYSLDCLTMVGKHQYNTLVQSHVNAFAHIPHVIAGNGSRGAVVVPKPITLRATLMATSLRDLLNHSRQEVNRLNREPVTYLTDELTMEKPLGDNLAQRLETPESRRDFFDRLENVELAFDLQMIDRSANSVVFMAECIQWRIVVRKL